MTPETQPAPPINYPRLIAQAMMAIMDAIMYFTFSMVVVTLVVMERGEDLKNLPTWQVLGMPVVFALALLVFREGLNRIGRKDGNTPS